MTINDGIERVKALFGELFAMDQLAACEVYHDFDIEGANDLLHHPGQIRRCIARLETELKAAYDQEDIA